MDACPEETPFHEASGRCVAECSGKAGEDGLCGNTNGSGVKVAVVVLACVGVLEVVAAVIIGCMARRRKSVAKQSEPLTPKKPALTLGSTGQLTSGNGLEPQ